MSKGLSIRSNDRVTLVGQTGSGKTYAARMLCAPLPRLLVMDTKGQLNDWNTVEWTGRRATALERDEPFRLRWIPNPGEYDLAESIFERVYYAGNMTVYIDEMTDIVPDSSGYGRWLEGLYKRGRSLGIGVYACTQRPKRVPLMMLSEATWAFCFRLKLVDDRKRMAEYMGAPVAAGVQHRHGFWISHQEWDNPRYYASVK